MANFITGIISITVSVVLFSSVYMATLKNTSTVGWSTSEVAMWSLLGILGVIGIAYGIMNVFGIV